MWPNERASQPPSTPPVSQAVSSFLPHGGPRAFVAAAAAAAAAAARRPGVCSKRGECGFWRATQRAQQVAGTDRGPEKKNGSDLRTSRADPRAVLSRVARFPPRFFPVRFREALSPPPRISGSKWPPHGREKRGDPPVGCDSFARGQPLLRALTRRRAFRFRKIERARSRQAATTPERFAQRRAQSRPLGRAPPPLTHPQLGRPRAR